MEAFALQADGKRVPGTVVLDPADVTGGNGTATTKIWLKDRAGVATSKSIRVCLYTRSMIDGQTVLDEINCQNFAHEKVWPAWGAP